MLVKGPSIEKKSYKVSYPESVVADYAGLAKWLIEKYQIESVLDVSPQDGFRKHFQRCGIVSRYNCIKENYYFIHDQKFDCVVSVDADSYNNLDITVNYNVKKIVLVINSHGLTNIGGCKLDVDVTNEAIRLFNIPTAMIFVRK